MPLGLWQDLKRLAMKNCRKPNSSRISTTSGITLLEVVLILMVLGILAATVAVHVSSGTADLTTTADGIASQLRLVQSLAMNNSRGLWGIRFESGTQTYHMFHSEDPSDCDMDRDIEPLPGADTDADGRISVAGNGIQFQKDGNVAFDDYGRPYEIKNKGATLLKNNPFTLTLLDGAGNTHDIQVTPKTGFIP